MPNRWFVVKSGNALNCSNVVMPSVVTMRTVGAIIERDSEVCESTFKQRHTINKFLCSGRTEWLVTNTASGGMAVIDRKERRHMIDITDCDKDREDSVLNKHFFNILVFSHQCTNSQSVTTLWERWYRRQTFRPRSLKVIIELSPKVNRVLTKTKLDIPYTMNARQKIDSHCLRIFVDLVQFFQTSLAIMAGAIRGKLKGHANF